MIYIMIFMGVTIVFLTLYIFINKKKQNRQIDELINYLTKVQDRGTFPELTTEAEGRMLILKSEIYKLATTLKEQYSSEANKNKYMADMLSNISHQIKTPLTAITIMTDVLKGDNLDEYERRKCIVNITKQTDHITWLVQTLLALAELDAGVLIMKKEQVRLDKLIGEITDSLALLADVKDVELRTLVGSEIILECDNRWTKEALLNIIKNCLEHTGEGGCVSISAGLSNLVTEIRIRDNGEGISEDNIPYIFRRFFHGDQKKADSNGIGLALSKQLIMVQNGMIDVTSKVGEGTEFVIRFYRTATI